MLDLVTHFVVLDTLRVKLKEQVTSGAVGDARADEALRAVEDCYPYAAMGSVVDHLLAHDGASDEELDLLRTAQPLYGQVRTLLEDFRDVRDRIEKLAQQTSVSADDYNRARWDLGQLLDRWDPLISALQSYAWQSLKRPLRHVTQHPQAWDEAVDAWPWRDVFLSRRTGAFAAEVMQNARKIGTPEALAFGVGTLAGYTGNVLGSPYLVQGVGGPRRSHPYRDRLASYSVGAWFRQAPAAVPPDFDPMRHVPVFGPSQNPRLPTWLVDLIANSLGNIYTSSGLPAPPDVAAAYPRLVEHWRLLNSFPAIPPPAPIEDSLDLRITNTLHPQDIYRPPPPTGGTAPGPAPGGGSGGSIFDPGPGAPPWIMPSHDNFWDGVKEGCLDVLLLPVFLIRVGFWLGHEASDSPPSGSGSAPVSGIRQRLENPLPQSQVDAVMGQKDILIAIDQLSQVDLTLHRMAVDCLRVMKTAGLLYPDPGELADPVFRQFLVLPPREAFRWPARPSPDPDRFLNWSTLSENPPRTPCLCADGGKPVSFLVAGYGTGPTVSGDGLDLVLSELLEDPGSPVRGSNLNLDADRGLGDECWELRKGTSVSDDPVSPQTLGYDDV